MDLAQVTLALTDARPMLADFFSILLIHSMR